MVTEITGNDLSKQKLWYSLKYNCEIVMAVKGDADIRMFFKGNEERRYFYVGENDGLKRQAQKAKTWGKIIELSDDDEISMAPDIVGEEDTPVKGGEEGSKASKGDGRNNENESMWPRSGLSLGRMDKHKQDIVKWKNGVGERIEQKLADTYKKMGCIAAVQCSLMLGDIVWS
ncbi:hypothetical protein Cgig2_020987 [Carnegiea gigantea]|uniref:Uncharacterized protein n=1 Tax=Carnegiea gigantea TaxID=171969 RepID=A0A9Q1KB25_9CARY|nr:hypothetical protein Cgig2_020987 [Carnegiea gigantea]